MESHNVEVTDAIKEHVQFCIDKIEHMNQRAVEARVHLERDHVGFPTNKFKCAIHLYFKGADLFAEDYENDLYASIDLVTKKFSLNYASDTTRSLRDTNLERQRQRRSFRWLPFNVL